MNLEYKNIIWDWNGTLLNDVHLTIDIMNGILEKQQIEQLDKDSYQAVFGFPIIQYYKDLGLDFKKESFQSLTKEFITHYNSRVRTCTLHESAKDVLINFDQQNKSQFILTAAFKKDVIELLSHYELASYFKAIEGLDNYEAASKVERGRALIEDNDLDPKECIMFGDTMHDEEVAKEMGIDCMLIANGHHSKVRLVQHLKDPEKVLNHISELLY